LASFGKELVVGWLDCKKGWFGWGFYSYSLVQGKKGQVWMGIRGQIPNNSQEAFFSKKEGDQKIILIGKRPS